MSEQTPLPSLPAEELLVDVTFDRGGKTIACRWSQPIDKPFTTVLFGPSGCGKTTILRGLAGLDKPKAGQLTFGNEHWYDDDKKLWTPPQQRRIGLLFQEYALFPHLNVAENIAYGMPRSPQRRTAADWLDQFQLSGLADRLPHRLSGGERQRVALARTLTTEPRLLLLDEPLSALDEVLRRELRGQLKQLLHDNGIPAVVVTHDRLEAMTLADQLVVLDQGRMLQQGPVAEVFNTPASPAVARIVGTDAILSGRCLRWEQGLAEVDISGTRLQVAAHSRTAGPVHLCIKAEHVSLQRTSPGPQSARNRLTGRVTNILPEGPLLRITVDCGFLLPALITRQAEAELQLQTGDEVTACIKATAIHLIAE